MPVRGSALTAFILCAAAAAAQAQVRGSVRGTVTDASGAPLPEVRVTAVEASRGALTDSLGRYSIEQVAAGTYTVTFQRIGYRPELRRVVVRATAEQDVVMEDTRFALPVLQVTATAGATSTFSSPQPLSVLSGEDLRRSQAASVGETIEQLPGLRSWSTGTGIGKPVIRGLTSNRVVVLADGQRLDYQQWGDEHSPNMETVTAEQIEVIRGPASVLYGSDALGGVVNVIARPLPEGPADGWTTRGRFAGAYGTNGRSPDAAVTMDAATRALALRGSVSGRRSEDIRTPRGSLLNSGNEALAGEATAAWRPGWGVLETSLARRAERLEIHGDPATDPGFTGYQRITDDRLRADLSVPFGSSRLEALAGYERNRRSEFGDASSLVVATGLLGTTWSVETRLHHAHDGPFVGVWGLSFVRGEFEMFGRDALIPDSRATNLAAYVMQRAELGRFELSAGGRYDHRLLDVDDEPRIGVVSQHRRYGAVTGNLGVLLHAAEPLALVLNLGRGFRAPAVAELFAHGEHEGTRQYEIGNPDIGTETSTNVDLAVRFRSRAFEAEGGVFANRIHDYIYLRPTGTTDSASGLPVSEFVQGDASLVGFEASFQVRPVHAVALRAAADWVRGQNVATDLPLPWMPPLRVTSSARYDVGRAGPLRGLFVTAGAEWNARQGRPDPNEYAPPGHAVANLGAGFTVRTFQGTLGVDIAVRNLFDASYANFLSRYKTYALAPRRSLTLRVTTEF